MKLEQLTPSKTLRGPLFPEPVQVIITTPMATAVKPVGRAVHSGKVVEQYRLKQDSLKQLKEPTTPYRTVEAT